MSRDDRRWLLFFCATIALIWATIRFEHATAQPQPRVHLGSDWYLIEFPNGSQWYVRQNGITAMHSFPDKDAKRLGYKSKVYGPGFTFNSPYTLPEMWDHIVEAKLEDLKVREDNK